MYLMQIAAAHSGRCGALVADVVRTAEKNGTSEMVTRLDIDLAVRSGALRYVACTCK